LNFATNTIGHTCGIKSMFVFCCWDTWDRHPNWRARKY